jgi:hypothetical protein
MSPLTPLRRWDGFNLSMLKTKGTIVSQGYDPLFGLGLKVGWWPRSLQSCDENIQEGIGDDARKWFNRASGGPAPTTLPSLGVGQICDGLSAPSSTQSLPAKQWTRHTSVLVARIRGRLIGIIAMPEVWAAPRPRRGLSDPAELLAYTTPVTACIYPTFPVSADPPLSGCRLNRRHLPGLA